MKQINSTTWKHIQKDDPRDRLVVEIGDSKVVGKFFPQVKIGRWGDTEQDNECNYSVRLIDNEPDIPQITTEDNKIKWRGDKLEAHFYEKENAYEFEVLLKEKPLTNKVRFSLQDKDVSYFFQPSLKKEKLEKGQTATDTDIFDKDGKVVAHRPINVVNSYAVYAKIPKTNWKGKKLYRTGKVGHIYRPKITDAKGNWTWGELNISNGILTITINQTWLDNAVYPVKVDPTFGYTTLGSSTGLYYGTDYVYGGYYTAPLDVGTIDSMSWGGHRCYYTNYHVKLFICNSDNSLVANSVTPPILITSQDYAFYTGAYTTSPSLVAGSSYYLVSIVENNNVETCYDDTGENVLLSEGGNSYESPHGLDPGGLTYTYRISIYCTYTAGGGTPVKIDKSLKYCVPTTPSAITKSLQYKIKAVETHKIEKSLLYKVETITKIGKVLSYKAVPAIAVQKTLKYAVEQTPSAKTKSLKYDVFLGSTNIQKSLGYRILTTPSAKIKQLKYDLLGSTNIEKSLEYSIAGEAVKVEKIFKYAVKTAPAAITKALGYNIYLGATQIQKSFQYAVRKAVAITKGLIYKVSPSTAINKTLKYCVLSTPAAKQKELRYAIAITPTALTKGLKYCVISTPAKTTKGLIYDILTETKIEKSLHYEIVSGQAITKLLKYTLVVSSVIQKSLTYAVLTIPTAIEKSLHYEIASAIAITKGLKYCIINQPSNTITKELVYSIGIGGIYPYEPMDSPYTSLDSPYEPMDSPYTPFLR